jgi:hypothetical protein
MSNVIKDGEAYAPKMDNSLTKAISDWWEGLTKDELLTYLAQQPTVTADSLRQMLSNEQAILNLSVAFSLSSRSALADFHTAVK